MTETAEETAAAQNGQPTQSLATTAARTLTTTTKTPPQMQGITSRWLLRILPWVQVSGGTYRVNRRLVFSVGDGRITFLQNGADVQVVPVELRELAALREFEDEEVLGALAERFVREEVNPGETIVEVGQPANQITVIVHGKVNKEIPGEYDEPTVQDVFAGGDHISYLAVRRHHETWPFTARAATRCILVRLSEQDFNQVAEQSDDLRAHIEQFLTGPEPSTNEFGEASVDVAAAHLQEDELPGTFVDYERTPREYELTVAQTVLRVHTRVADLFNDPMNQTEKQLNLTIQALRERQEHEIVNNREIGLLHNAAFSQRIHSRTGPPTPDDFDELLSLVWKKPGYFLAHPRTIAAFARECNHRGLYPTPTAIEGHTVPAWRGIPLLPCNKIPISNRNTSSVMLMRVGEEDRGVVGLHQAGIPDEYEPSLSVRFMRMDEKGIISYLVTIYYSAAVLVPDALALLDDVQIGRYE